MKRRLLLPLAAVCIASLTYFSCGEEAKDDDKDPPPGGGPGGGKSDGETDSDDNGTDTAESDGCRGGAATSIADGAPDWIKSSFKCVTVTMSDDQANVIFNTKDLPNYKSAYYGANDDWYEAMPTGNAANPNTIVAQNYVVTIPAAPTEAADTTATSMDLVGIAVNGVAIYNNAAAPGDTLASEFDTFDQGNGHPTQTGSYHYHTDPLKITLTGKELVGIMRDGFPIYGMLDEDGSSPDDLDEAHGHKHATTLFPGGIYHYHVTDTDPYIVEVYRGTPGTMTND